MSVNPPATRGDCVFLPRPCTRFRCRYNLPVEMETGCALDLAEQGPRRIEDIAAAEGISKTTVNRIIHRACKRLAEYGIITFSDQEKPTP